MEIAFSKRAGFEFDSDPCGCEVQHVVIINQLASGFIFEAARLTAVEATGRRERSPEGRRRIGRAATIDAVCVANHIIVRRLRRTMLSWTRDVRNDQDSGLILLVECSDLCRLALEQSRDFRCAGIADL